VIHRIAGYEVVRFSALQVFEEPDTVVAALLAAAPSLAAEMPQIVHGRPCAARTRL
jgi:very-short-patch-repair endonuclease